MDINSSALFQWYVVSCDWVFLGGLWSPRFGAEHSVIFMGTK